MCRPPIQIMMMTLLALLAGTISAAAADQHAEAYLKQVLEANQTLKKAGFQVGVQFGPILSGQEPDAAKLQSSVHEAKQTFTKVAVDLQQAVPPNSEEAKAFAAAHAKFMAGQEQIINNEFVMMMNVALDRNKSLAQRKANLEQGLQAVARVEQDSLRPLVEAFLSYTQKYEIKVQ